MRKFGRSSDTPSFEHSETREKLVGLITDIKKAPQAGFKRLSVRDKTHGDKPVTIDVPHDKSKELERNKQYKFLVEEKPAKTYGMEPKRRMGFMAYDTSDAPEEVRHSFERRKSMRSDGRSAATSNTRKHQT